MSFWLLWSNIWFALMVIVSIAGAYVVGYTAGVYIERRRKKEDKGGR